MTLSYEVCGQRQLVRSLSRFADKVRDFSPAFREIVGAFREMEALQFRSQGGYGGDPWAPLAPSTARRRGAAPILIRSGALLDSLTGGAGFVEEVHPMQVRMGSAVPYGRYHQLGTMYMPARSPIRLPESEKQKWMKIMHRYVVKQIKGVS